MIIEYFGLDKLEVKHWMQLTAGYLIVFPFFHTPINDDWTIMITVAIMITFTANILVTVPLLIEGIRYIRKNPSLSAVLWRRLFLANFFLHLFVVLGRYI